MPLYTARVQQAPRRGNASAAGRALRKAALGIAFLMMTLAPVSRCARKAAPHLDDAHPERLVRALDAAGSVVDDAGKSVAPLPHPPLNAVLLDDAGRLVAPPPEAGAPVVDAGVLLRALDTEPEALDALARARTLRVVLDGRRVPVMIRNIGDRTHALYTVRPNVHGSVDWRDPVGEWTRVNEAMSRPFRGSDTRILAMFDPAQDGAVFEWLDGVADSGARVSAAPGTGAGIERMLRRIDEDTIVIFGHVENGSIQVKASNEQTLCEISIERAREIVAARDRTLVVYGCGAGNSGVTGPLNEMRAHEAAERLTRALKAADCGEFFSALASPDAPLLVHDVETIHRRTRASVEWHTLAPAGADGGGGGGAPSVGVLGGRPGVFVDVRDEMLRRHSRL